jgi:uncharacterized protein
MAHENVTFDRVVAGQPVVAYMGDDARGEYIYKFVSDAQWDPKDASAANRLAAGDKYLDKGTLFVARFKDDGTGEWVELSMNNPVIANSSYSSSRATPTSASSPAWPPTPWPPPRWTALSGPG